MFQKPETSQLLLLHYIVCVCVCVCVYIDSTIFSIIYDMSV